MEKTKTKIPHTSNAKGDNGGDITDEEKLEILGHIHSHKYWEMQELERLMDKILKRINGIKYKSQKK